MTFFPPLFLALFQVTAGAVPGIPAAARPLMTDLAAVDVTPLWPGYTPLIKPLGLHFKGHGTYLLGAKSRPKNAEAVEGFSRLVYFFRDKKADALSSDFSQTFHTDEAGDIFLFGGPKGLLQAEIVIIHETFHLFQDADFRDRSSGRTVALTDNFLAKYVAGLDSIKEWWAQRGHKDNEPEKNNTAEIMLAYIEDQLLAQALLEKSDYRTLVAEFETVREYRRSKLSFSALQYEIKQERIEGTAEYVGWSSVAKQYSPLLAYNAQAGALLSPRPLLNREKRFYAPGAAQCFLLDRAGADWKGRVETGEDIFSLIKEYFPKTNDARPLSALKQRYTSLWLKGALGSLDSEQRRKQRDAEEYLKKHDGWKISFQSPSYCQDYSSTCYDDVVDLGDGRAYLGNCHTELSCKDVSISIEAPMVRDGRNTTVLLGRSVPQITIDALHVTDISSGKAFNTLSLKAPGFSAELLNGNITSTGKTITIKR